MKSTLGIIPVLSTSDIPRDLEWHKKYTGFELCFGDDKYCGICRDGLEIHLQWHLDNDDDPVHGSVIKIFVEDIDPVFHEFVGRGTIKPSKLRRDTPWGTHEFGFYDLNGNAIYFVQDVDNE